jgi:periplasmic protein TonB
MNQRLLPIAQLACVALLAACSTPRAPDAPTPATVGTPSAARAAIQPPATAGASSATATKVSLAASPKAYRVDGAKHLYAVYGDRIFKGKLPPLIHAVVVVEVGLDRAGNVGDIEMVRVPSHAPEVVAEVRKMIRAASPLPAPQRLGAMRYTDIWLVDRSGRFQLDTLTEGQL